MELGKLLKKLLFNGLNELSQIQAVFAPSTLPENLKNLLSKLLVEKVAFFRQKLLNEEGWENKLSVKRAMNSYNNYIKKKQYPK